MNETAKPKKKRSDRLLNVYLLMATSFLLSVVLGTLGYCFLKLHEVTNFIKVLDGYLLFTTITFGFFGTCISILATLLNAPIMKQIFGKYQYKKQFGVLVLATMIYGLIAITITIVFQMTIGFDDHGFFNFMGPKLISAIWIASGTNYTIGLFLVTLISMAILFQSDRKENPTGKREHKVRQEA